MAYLYKNHIKIACKLYKKLIYVEMGHMRPTPSQPIKTKPTSSLIKRMIFSYMCLSWIVYACYMQQIPVNKVQQVDSFLIDCNLLHCVTVLQSNHHFFHVLTCYLIDLFIGSMSQSCNFVIATISTFHMRILQLCVSHCSIQGHPTCHFLLIQTILGACLDVGNLGPLLGSLACW